jgi:hypothetical protein
MIPTEQDLRAPLGAHGEPCTQCGTPLARDQRYCLACGARRAGLSPVLTDAPLVAWPGAAPGQVAAPPVGPPPTVKTAAAGPAPSWWSGDAGVLAGAACLLLALLVGVLIGRAGRDPAPQRAAAPQVITVGGAAGNATATPSGSAAPSATATAAATASATPTATPAASKSKKKGAKAIQDIQGATGSDYSKKSAKLPKTLTTPGAPPPKDNKPAGAGSGSETFK